MEIRSETVAVDVIRCDSARGLACLLAARPAAIDARTPAAAKYKCAATARYGPVS